MVLERLVADGKTPQKLAARARIVLLSGRGLGTSGNRAGGACFKTYRLRWQGGLPWRGIEPPAQGQGKGPGPTLGATFFTAVDVLSITFVGLSALTNQFLFRGILNGSNVF